MAEQTNDLNISGVKQKSNTRAVNRLIKFGLVRAGMLFLAVVLSVYLTIMIANMGGYVDNIMRGEIREAIAARLLTDQNYQQLAPEEKQSYVANLVIQEEERRGLNEPFAVRSVTFLKNALTLNLGRAINMTSDQGSKKVSEIILDRLPPTLLLMGTANLLLFFAAIFIALSLSRNYGSLIDKAVVAMSPASSAPPWFYGIFFIVLFAAIFRILPFGGMIDSHPPATTLGYILSVLKHMILPVAALVISAIFFSVYNWRTFFLIYSSEDYVEMAKAKGLSKKNIERRYILRPTLPTIITNFSLMLIGIWTGAIITETVFKWPGVGSATYQAIGLFDTPVIVGVTIVSAYLLAITVFMLDFLYALVDPRVKVGV